MISLPSSLYLLCNFKIVHLTFQHAIADIQFDILWQQPKVKSTNRNHSKQRPERNEDNGWLGLKFLCPGKNVIHDILTLNSTYMYWHPITLPRPDTKYIYINVGFGFHVQMTLEEALMFIEKKNKQLQNRADKYSEEAAKIRANIKLVTYYRCDHTIYSIMRLIMLLW